MTKVIKKSSTATVKLKRHVGKNLRAKVVKKDDVSHKSGAPDFYVPSSGDATTARDERTNKLWKPAEGRNMILVLPPTTASGLKMPWLISAAHYVGGKDVTSLLGIDRPDDLPMAHGCLKEMRGEKCLWCEKMAELQRSKSKKDKKLARALYPSREYIANIVDMASPKTARLGKLAKTVIEALTDAIEDGHLFCDPEKLCKVVIRRKGSGMGTKYSAKVLPDSVGAIRSVWVKTMTDLQSATYPFPDEDEVQEAMDLLFESAVGVEEADLGLDSDFNGELPDDDDVTF